MEFRKEVIRFKRLNKDIVEIKCPYCGYWFYDRGEGTYIDQCPSEVCGRDIMIRNEELIAT